ncbi:hypothetical protein NEUTE1DRAFT_131702 [Neurospora tetrasperma FGSC 2508]|uniref:DNA replication ATP-dependent helicase/nuclease DNA2 n=1 Tax=Neurospora tetrasperma (strain FGSC 2508 / ATCC MYA-4615 / P0657) TaxID=510951 RepID=F8MW71_NEUT8|nr:uncharacterized protein NEUTE1DRAFT_131702 [Neurospora tetrasperma FGSC 2508]EGO54066.1 hypothetical protein NEUTE1DRAFT_131702 [Neurospora tetrasperma FGSC 2508]EGZ68511.1 Dna2-domain-containing protein [Neurospora tetrasperma FGSC 2509]
MPLKKSYSDAYAQPPKRGGWQRTRSNPPNKGPLQSLAPVSESSKNKLQAFRSDDTSSKPPPKSVKPVKAASNELQKENINTTKSIPRKRPLPDSNDEPSSDAKTPADRHSWKDLFGVPEVITEEEDGEKSPGDRVDWRSGVPLQLPASPMIPKNGRRRAKSSSPASSPAAKLTTPHVALKRFAGASKTPHADPASDLWSRYSSNGNETSPSNHKNPLFAQLMASSSPRPQSSDRSLRKSVSCGSAWPKRRRTLCPDEQDRIVSQDTPRKKKSSLLSELLQSVDGEIDSSKKPNSAPAQQKKSPSPKKKSPSKRKTTPQTVPDQNSSPSRKKAERQSTETDASKQPEKASSDYGDDDFDFDESTLLELDASILGQGDGSTLMASDAVSPAPRESSKTLVDNDEFGDLDDDIFDGVEDLVAQVESATQKPAQRLSPRKRPSPKKRLSPRKTQSPKKLPQQVAGDEDDEFGDDFGNDFDFDAVEMAATQRASHAQDVSSHPSQKPRAIQRYLVTNVLESSYTDDRGRESPEKILIVQADRTNSVRTIHLRGDWFDTPASVSAYVHIIGQFEDQGKCVVDNNQNMLILHPDQLISSTVVADSFSCMRRAVLQDRVKATSDLSPALVYGTILHEIFQEALVANKWDPAFLTNVINKTLEKHLEDLYILKVGMDDAKSHVQSKMPELRSWAQLFVTSQPKPDAIVQGRNGDKATMCVSKLLDVEEHVWSPMYGLKGNIDATVQVTMRDPPARGSSSKASTTKTLTVPFEVKTGKNVNSNHQAQTALYNLLLSDRYDIEIVYGILYYMETSQTLRIPAVRHEIRHMIMQRNQLACYIRERSVQLPPMKKSKNACGRCYAQTTCFIYHKLADDGDGETSAMNEKFDEVVNHLSPTHKEFFLKWEELLTKEEKESQKLRRELWTMVSTEREKVGRCFANVIIEEGSAYENHQQMGKTNRFAYTFIKDKPAPGFSFLDSQLTVGEPIVISDEQGHFALALGYVTSVRKTRIAVAVDRRLHNARVRQPGFDEADNQVFASIMQVPGSGDNAPEDREAGPVRYRLDKDEFSNGMATVRNNLVQIMADGVFGSRQIRRLVVDLEAPRFKAVPTQYILPSTASGQGLNVDQKAAVEKIPDMDALATKHFDADSFLAYSEQHPLKEGDKLSFCPYPTLTTCWLRDLLDPSARVRFINTDSLLPHSREEKSTRGQRIVNPLESRIVCQLVDSLLTVGVPASEIGVMTHYRSQLALLKHNMKNTLGGSAGAIRAGVKVAAEEIEMHTADRFQGRDKSVVVLSLVRSNEGCSIGELLKDWRRINVAFTRAKTKLLVVGSRETLRGASSSVAGSPSAIASPELGETGDDQGEGQGEPEGGEMLARFVRMMEDRNWVYELRAGALEGHRFADANAASTAADALSPRKPNPIFKPVSPRKGSALSPSKKANAKLAGKGYKVQSKLQFGTPSQGKENVGSQSLKSPKKGIVGGGKHNPKRIGISERAIMKGRPIMRDIMNEITDGRF